MGVRCFLLADQDVQCVNRLPRAVGCLLRFPATNVAAIDL